jgi:flagella basal body P-ring formation protein FlgA
VVAAHDLHAGQRLAAADFRLETEAALRDSRPVSIEELSGRRLRRTVRAGTAVRVEWTDFPPDVARGETVQVEVRCGAAMLAFEGRAEASGTAGQTVAVFNPRTRKRFQARVEGPGRFLIKEASIQEASLEGAKP